MSSAGTSPTRTRAAGKDPAVAATRRAVRAALADLPTGAVVVAAVSGGADSLALAAALAWVAPRRGHHAGAVVVDHGLQPHSADIAASAAETCRSLGLAPVDVVRVSVDAAGGPEAAARAARYDALARLARRDGAAAVLTGHTLDDQAETVLLGLGRGSGARSLSGMAPSSVRAGALLLRPFLGIRRQTTTAACAALGLQPWQDPHNTDRSYARARVRHDALPALEAALGPGVAEALARTADLLRGDADALDALADAGAVDGLAVGDLLGLPAAVRTRVLRRAAIAAGARAGGLTQAHVGELERLVVDWRGQHGVSLPGGLVAERRCDRLSFR
jgi:tRNA(Ile)-lysidine synthase